MPKFRKKPIVIDATQYCGQVVVGVCHCDDVSVVHIHTLEGVMEVGVGDWVITGIEGENYPCKDSIFQATYEPVHETAGERAARVVLRDPNQSKAAHIKAGRALTQR